MMAVRFSPVLPMHHCIPDSTLDKRLLKPAFRNMADAVLDLHLSPVL